MANLRGSEGKLRQVLYRASVSEMVVPYGDPSAAWFFRATFDEGELGLGQTALPRSAKMATCWPASMPPARKSTVA